MHRNYVSLVDSRQDSKLKGREFDPAQSQCYLKAYIERKNFDAKKRLLPLRNSL